MAQGLGAAIGERQEACNDLDQQVARLDGELTAASMTADEADALIEMLKGNIEALVTAEPEDQARDLKTLITQVVLITDPTDKKKGQVNLSINLPRSSGTTEKLVPSCPMVERNVRRTNVVRIS